MLTRPEAYGVYIQTWNVENRLQAVTVNGQTTSFVYNGDGQRIKRVAPDGITYYVGNHYEKFVAALIPKPTAIAATRAPAGLTMKSMPCIDFCLTPTPTAKKAARTPTATATRMSTATATRTSTAMATRTSTATPTPTATATHTPTAVPHATVSETKYYFIGGQRVALASTEVGYLESIGSE